MVFVLMHYCRTYLSKSILKSALSVLSSLRTRPPPEHTFRVRDHLAYLRSRIAQEVLLVCFSADGQLTLDLIVCSSPDSLLVSITRHATGAQVSAQQLV
jgi:hypothetical protein